MRLLIIFLIAANAASFFWIRQTIGSESAATNHGLAQLPNSESAVSITLLRELGNATFDKVPGADGTEPTQTSQNTLQSKLSPPDDDLAAQTLAKVEEEVDATNSAETISADSEELGDAATPAAFKFDEEPLPDGLCWFVDVAAEPRKNSQPEWLSTLSAYLGELGINADIVDVKVPKPLKYVVYIPPTDSKAASLARLRGLLSDGYDAFVFRDGEYKNGISLGFYSQKEIAYKMLDKFRGEGLAVELAPWRSFKTDTRLRVDNPSSGRLAGGLWNSVEAEWRGIEREKKYCDAVASR